MLRCSTILSFLTNSINSAHSNLANSLLRLCMYLACSTLETLIFKVHYGAVVIAFAKYLDLSLRAWDSTASSYLDMVALWLSLANIMQAKLSVSLIWRCNRKSLHRYVLSVSHILDKDGVINLSSRITKTMTGKSPSLGSPWWTTGLLFLFH